MIKKREQEPEHMMITIRETTEHIMIENREKEPEHIMITNR